MKIILVGFFIPAFVIILFGCNNDSPTIAAEADAIADSMEKIETRPDRIGITAEEKTKAFGKLRFGMSQSQCEKLEDLYGFTDLGNGRYSIRGLFTSGDSLYQVIITSVPKDANYFYTDVKEETDNLISLIKTKYGDPDKYSAYPSIRSMQSGYLNFTDTWSLGDKTINIGVGENEARFYAVCHILSEKLLKNEQLKIDQENFNKIHTDKNKF